MRAGIVSGGTAAALEMRTAIVTAGTQVAAEIAAAMRGGAVPLPGGRGRAPVPAPVPTGEPLPPVAGPGGIRGLLDRIGGGRGALRGALRLSIWADIGIGMARGVVTAFQKNVSEGARKALSSITLGGSEKLAQLFGIKSDEQIAQMEADSEKVYQAGLRLGRHTRAGIDAGLGGRSGLSTGILNQLRVSFRNLGERATGGLGELRRVFRENLDQISADIPKHTRSWSRAVSENTRRMMQAVARNVRQGRIPVATGFDEIRRLMASRSLRGRDAVVAAFRSAAAGIRRWLSAGRISVGTYTDQMDAITRTFLRRMHVRVSEFTRSYRKAFADLIQAGVDAQTALFALRRSAKFGDPESGASDRPSQDELFPPPRRPRRRRGPVRVISTHSGGGVLPGYGGGDIIPALLEAGEGILRKEVVRAIGPARIDALNRDPSSLVRLNYGGDGMMAHAVSFSPRGGGALSGGNVNHINITTAPKPDLPPDPAVVAAQLTMHMRARGLG
jgi:hypothetical protein